MPTKKAIKPEPIELGITYNGVGNFIIGLPARDMTQAEWLSYSETLRARALASGLYTESIIEPLPVPIEEG
jgi:hypothetical protein